MSNVFVYGTLMTGQPRNYVVNHLEHISCVLKDHKRIWPEALGFPFILKSEGDIVEGELYIDVSKELWNQLDGIEGEGYLYHRIPIEVNDENNKKYMAFTYYPSENLSKRFI